MMLCTSLFAAMAYTIADPGAPEKYNSDPVKGWSYRDAGYNVIIAV